MVHLLSALMLVLLLNIAECRTKPAIHLIEEESADESNKWGYVEVREDAHMFYWLYYSSHPDGYENRPWIIWLQGGPGSSSCGFGNFHTIGPLDVKMKPRNTTWVKQANVLFIDSPVGAGFSHVGNDSAYNTEVEHVIDDLMELLRVFLERNPIFTTFPLHIFGHSYGGKVAAYLSQRLYDAIGSEQMEVNLIGLALGNAWISPMDHLLNYADLALSMSLVDEYAWARIQRQALNGSAYLTRLEIFRDANDVDIFDFSQFTTDNGQYDPLFVLIKELQKSKKRIPPTVVWERCRPAVKSRLDQHYMKPSVNVVDDLLKTTDLQVIIYQGQLDIFCNTKGTTEWVQKLTWSNLTSYHSAERKALINPVDNQIEGFVKAYGKFKFYTILGAGHAVAQAKGDAALRMLERILKNVDQ